MRNTSVFLLIFLPALALAEAPAVSPIPAADKRPGYGVVEKVQEVRLVPGEASASAGASRATAAQPAYRVTVRLPDGSLQQRDLHKPEFKPGDKVLLTNAGDIVPD
jgi:hypothetical protein